LEAIKENAAAPVKAPGCHKFDIMVEAGNSNR
jgi:hypothetical protein